MAATFTKQTGFRPKATGTCAAESGNKILVRGGCDQQVRGTRDTRTSTLVMVVHKPPNYSIKEWD